MGLTTTDVNDITRGWNETITLMLRQVVKHKGFAWNLFDEINNFGRDELDPRSNCAEWLRNYCVIDNPFLKSPIFFPFTRIGHKEPFPLPAFYQDLATFLLVRGPYAWIGYSWEPLGCHPDIAWEYRNEMATDYGTPISTCEETSAGSGVFTREWTKATVTMDCPNWKGSIQLKGEEIVATE